MLCLKILHRHWICSIFVFSFSLFFSVFGLSHDSFATIKNCTWTSQVSFSNVQFNLNTLSVNATPSSLTCDSNSVTNFAFIRVNSLSENFIALTSDTTQYISRQNSSVSFSHLARFSLLNGSDSFSLSSPIILFNNVNDGSNGYVYASSSLFVRGLSNITFFSIDFDISDSFTDFFPPSEPCQVCPDIPENPYDNKLDDIKKAIYCCGAVLIMLYFFFCIYKIIVKDGGSR